MTSALNSKKLSNLTNKRMSDKELQSLTILMKELSTKFDSHVNHMGENLARIEKSLEAKAGNWTEKVLAGGAATIVLYILGALLGLFSIPMVNGAAHKTVTFIQHLTFTV